MLNTTGWKTNEVGVRRLTGVRDFSPLQTSHTSLVASYPKDTDSASSILIPVPSVREADPSCPPSSGVNMLSSLPPLSEITSQHEPVPTLYYVVY